MLSVPPIEEMVGTAGATVRTAKVKAAEAALVLPAESEAVAVMDLPVP